jgi:hypothetical protein
MEKQLMKIDPKEFGLDENQAKEVENSFIPVIIERDALAEKYELIINSEISKILTIDAHDLRMKIMKIRTSTDRIHKTAKAFYLAGGRFVDAWKNKNNAVCEQMENKLFEIEDHFAAIERQKKAEIAESRKNELVQLEVDVTFFNLADMPEENYLQLLETSKLQLKLRKEAEQKAEQERIAKEKAEAEERERIRIENEKLRKEAEEREKQITEERAKVEAERKRIEAENNKKFEAERKEKERIAAELKAKQQKEQEEKDRLAREEKAKKDAEKKALRAPDKDKLTELATRIVSIQMPDVKSDEAKQILLDVQNLLNKTSNFIKEKSLSL